ncbi:Meiosis protein mei2 [Zalerion maritima]|uniref:Meiosis protein mei2 n=1 Tax=Zalerion maritima TaxID=339359 RepID=A0AAD5WNX3_9PEZI|nr:Meiosis protein mei2 [Zalerion maritima]
MARLSPTAADFSPSTPFTGAGGFTPLTVSPFTPATPMSSYGHFISPLHHKGSRQTSRIPGIEEAAEHSASAHNGSSHRSTSEYAMTDEAQVNNNKDVSTETSLSQSISRCIRIESHDGRALDSTIIERLQFVANNIAASGIQVYMINGKVYVRFDDIKEALEVHPQIPGFEHGLEADYISPKEFVQTSNANSNLTTIYEGQVSIVIHAGGPVKDEWKKAEATVKTLLSVHGTLFAFERISSPADGVFRATAEFCSVSSSLTAVSTLNGINYEGFRLVLRLHRPDITIVSAEDDQKNSDTPTQETPTMSTSGVEDVTAAVQNMAMMASQNTPSFPHGLVPMQHAGMPIGVSAPYFYQPIGPSTLRGGSSMPAAIPGPLARLDSLHSQVAITPGFQLVQSPFAGSFVPFSEDYLSGRSGRSNFVDSPRGYSERLEMRRPAVMRRPQRDTDRNNNHVDVTRIREGADVRTTIMLRNIPNKVDQPMLKAIIDESSWGKYDFMYLRIDFQNDCNVGYAFINFVDPLDIIDFVNARGNQRWYDFVMRSNDPVLTRNRNCFKSDKVAEISYATIQGKDCLVQKFRNSSVMLEQPHYRPKLYFTQNGPHPEMAGQEEPFPSPDNHSKMRRSVENAEHVGKFVCSPQMRASKCVTSSADAVLSTIVALEWLPSRSMATRVPVVAINIAITSTATRLSGQGQMVSALFGHIDIYGDDWSEVILPFGRHFTWNWTFKETAMFGEEKAPSMKLSTWMWDKDGLGVTSLFHFRRHKLEMIFRFFFF